MAARVIETAKPWVGQPDEAWRQAAEEDDAPAGSEPRIAPRTEDHVRQLAADGFTVGVHTASHARLSGAPLAVQRAELVSCREALQSWTQQPIDAVAYPFGAPGLDYTADTLAIAASLGLTAGFTTRPDFNRPAEDPLERSRFVVLAAVNAAELAHRITYAWPR